MIRLAVTLILIILICPAAFAHSWYPPECCSDRDCVQLDPARVKVTPQGYLIDGKTLVPHDKARWSPDEHYHGCFRAYFAGPILQCFFAPQKGM